MKRFGNCSIKLFSSDTLSSSLEGIYNEHTTLLRVADIVAACMFVFSIILLCEILLIITWSVTWSIGVLFNIIVRVDDVVAFEVSFLKAYDCWAVFCNKKQQFRVIDPYFSDSPLDYFIIHLVLRFWRISILSFACLWSFIFNLHIFEFFKFVWCGHQGGLCLCNSFNWVLFFKSNIFCFIFLYGFVNIWRSDWWSLLLSFRLFSHFRAFFSVGISIYFSFSHRVQFVSFVLNIFFLDLLEILAIHLLLNLPVFHIYLLVWCPGVVNLLLCFSCFWERYVFGVLDEHYFFFFLINSTDSWKGRVFRMTVCAFYIFAFIFHMVWTMFATFPTHLASSANLFVESKVLTFEALQGSWYIMLYSFCHVANFDFFWDWCILKGQNICKGLYSFIILLYSFTPWFLKTVSISSGVTSESSTSYNAFRGI